MTQSQHSRKSTRKLTSAEVDLWREVTRDVRRRRPRPVIIPEQAEDSAAEPAAGAEAARKRPEALQAQNRAIQPLAAPPLKPLIALDSKTRKSIRQGGQEVEARIDLHGMRQDAAHTALRRFIVQTHAAGLRIVLVITGKGKLDSQLPWLGEDGPGVLRRAVPHWLADPSLRMLVSGYGVAERKHGGEGALYVRLRRRKS